MEDRTFSSMPDLYATIVHELAPFMQVANEAFELGAAHAYEAREQLRTRLGIDTVERDPWYEAQCVRMAAKQHLLLRGMVAKDYKLGNLSMCGLQIYQDNWELRARKAFRGNVPWLKADGTIRAFCQQSLPGEFGDVPWRHLFLLWHLDDAGRYTGLSLVYPRGEHDGVVHALVRVDYPAHSFATDSSTPDWSDTVPEAGDLDLQLGDDLDEENGEEQAQ